MATISTRITLEGGDAVKKQLQDLGAAGEKSFKQIQDAAKQTQVDPQRFSQAQQALKALAETGTQLANQFVDLANAAGQFGETGAQATTQVTNGLQKTTEAAKQAGDSLLSAATKFKIAVAAIAAAAGALITSLTKGVVDTASGIAGQADKLSLTVEQWVKMRQAAAQAGVSFDDFAKGVGKGLDLIQKLGEEIGKNAQVYSVLNAAGEKVNVTVTHGGELAGETAKQFLALGVNMRTLLSGDKVAILQAVADAIAKMPEGARQTAAGIKFFGDNWKDVIQALSRAKKAIDDGTDALEKQRRASRQLTAEQVDAADKLGKTWKDLGNAIRATRDQIGAFFVAGQQAKAEWLTKLVDDTRELLKKWLELGNVERPKFLADLTDKPAETAFKTLIALGQILGDLWDNVLVPAGQALMDAMSKVGDAFDGVTKEQVIAGFVAMAAAVVALAVAFKGISFVLSPVTALISLFASWGTVLVPLIALVVLFWDEISKGAQKVADLIPDQLQQIKEAFAALFKGDFTTFWSKFSAAAVDAFNKIKDALGQTEWGSAIAGAFAVIKEQVPGTITLIIEGLVALGKAAQAVADVLNKLFGTGLTGTDIAALVIIGQMTGGLQALASAAVIAGAAVTVLAGLFGGPVAAGIIAIAALFIAFREQIKGFFDALQSWGEALRESINTPVANAWQWIVDSFNSAVDGIKSAIESAWQFIQDFVTTPIGNAWQWIVDKWNAMLAALGLGGGGGSTSPGGGGSGFAAGGLLGGRGTGTSDSNLAWVSRGEYITPAAAVAQPGVLGFLEALRRTGGDLRSVLNGMGRFALGGLVPTPSLAIPAYAGGGMNNVTIAFPGLPEIAGLRAPSHVVDDLRRAAVMAQVRSGGRKPSRYS